MKIVINRKFGGFGISDLAAIEYCKRKNNGNVYIYADFLFVKGKDYASSDDDYKKLAKVDEEFVRNINKYQPLKCIDFYYSMIDYGDVVMKRDVLDSNKAFRRGIDFERTDPTLVSVVEDLGEQASYSYSKLCVVEIPDDVDWYIEDYDGMETIHERHRVWC